MLRYTPLDTASVRALQAGGPDANGQPAERQISTGAGNPCRHCLKDIPEGEPMLVLAHRPFPGPQPYAETGPLFLCAAPCLAPADDTALPDILCSAPDYLIKGYSSDDRIVYGTGAVVARDNVSQHAKAILARDDIAYLHVRSARNNCYQLRIDRG